MLTNFQTKNVNVRLSILLVEGAKRHGRLHSLVLGERTELFVNKMAQLASIRSFSSGQRRAKI